MSIGPLSSSRAASSFIPSVAGSPAAQELCDAIRNHDESEIQGLINQVNAQGNFFLNWTQGLNFGVSNASEELVDILRILGDEIVNLNIRDSNFASWAEENGVHFNSAKTLRFMPEAGPDVGDFNRLSRSFPRVKELIFDGFTQLQEGLYPWPGIESVFLKSRSFANISNRNILKNVSQIFPDVRVLFLTCEQLNGREYDEIKKLSRLACLSLNGKWSVRSSG